MQCDVDKACRTLMVVESSATSERHQDVWFVLCENNHIYHCTINKIKTYSVIVHFKYERDLFWILVCVLVTIDNYTLVQQLQTVNVRNLCTVWCSMMWNKAIHGHKK